MQAYTAQTLARLTRIMHVRKDNRNTRRTMEYAVYEVFFKDGRRMGSFVNMLATHEEAVALAVRLEGEHEIVGLWTREITEKDEQLWHTVSFDEEGGFKPVGESLRDA